MKSVSGEIKEAVRFSYRYVQYVITDCIINKDVVWMEGDDSGKEFSRERWTRRKKLQVLRPRYQGLLTDLPCGCQKRLWRWHAYRWGCVEGHGSMNAERLAQRREGESF